MKVILLAGYRFDSNVDDAPGMRIGADGRCTLDLRIDELTALGFAVVCVVTGDAADAQVRRARRLRDVELVFDTNAARANLVSNVRAGLGALLPHEPALVLPVEIPCPPAEAWRRLKFAARAAAPNVSLAQLAPSADPRDFGFPLLVTPFGKGELARLTDLSSLADTRLEYLRPAI